METALPGAESCSVPLRVNTGPDPGGVVELGDVTSRPVETKAAEKAEYHVVVLSALVLRGHGHFMEVREAGRDDQFASSRGSVLHER